MRQYIVSFDSDDILLPDALSIYHKIIEYFEQPAIIMAKMQYFKNLSTIDFNSWDRSKIHCTLFDCYFKKNQSRGFSNSTLIIKKDKLLKIDGYLANSDGLDDNILLFRLGTEGPFISIDYPSTVAYRVHESNWSKNINRMVDSTILLINNERLNILPGGKKYQFDRRGKIGTLVMSIMKYYLGFKNFDKILILLFHARNMLLIGIIRRFLLYFYSEEKRSIKVID